MSLLLGFLFLGITTAGATEILRCPEVGAELAPHSAWLRAENGMPGAIALLAHGLNLQPERMDSIAKVLNAEGVDVFRASLSGHRGSEEEFKKVTREQWVKDLFFAYCQARREADEKKIPLHFVGYSVGALINLDLMNSFPDAQVSYDRMVLFAPAASVNATSYLVRLLGIFGGGFVVPSASNPAYRANADGTPMAAYRALFDSLGVIESSGVKKSDVPTLIFIDPRDELVSERGLRNLIDLNQLSQWKILEVTNEGTTLEKGAYHHLIIDEPSLGAAQWGSVKEALRRHLIGG